MNDRAKLINKEIIMSEKITLSFRDYQNQQTTLPSFSDGNGLSPQTATRGNNSGSSFAYGGLQVGGYIGGDNREFLMAKTGIGLTPYRSPAEWTVYAGLGGAGTNKTLNADLPEVEIDPDNSNTYIDGVLPNGLKYTITEYNPNSYEYIMKVDPNQDTDSIRDGVLHLPNDGTTDKKYRVKKVVIQFQHITSEYAFERKLVLHAGPNWSEYFIYNGYVFQLDYNLEPERVVMKAFPVGQEQEATLRGNVNPVQLK